MARRMAVAGWTAAALVVSGSLALPSCAGKTTGDPDDGGAGVDTGIGPGVCPVSVDSGIDTGLGPGVCPVSPDAGVDTGYLGGICGVSLDAAADGPAEAADAGPGPDTGTIGPGICPVLVEDTGGPPPVGGIC